jgi:hypothetical protein
MTARQNQMLAKNKIKLSTINSFTTATNNPNVATVNIYSLDPSIRDRLRGAVGDGGGSRRLQAEDNESEVENTAVEGAKVENMEADYSEDDNYADQPIDMKEYTHEDVLDTSSEAVSVVDNSNKAALVTFMQGLVSQVNQVIQKRIADLDDNINILLAGPVQAYNIDLKLTFQTTSTTTTVIDQTTAKEASMLTDDAVSVVDKPLI